MADSRFAPLIQALTGEETKQRFLQRDPFAMGASGLLQADLTNPDGKWYENLGVTALQGLVGGLLGGMGQRRAQEQYNQFVSDASTLMQNPDSFSQQQFVGRPELDRFARQLQSTRMLEAANLAEQRREQDQELQTDLMKKGLMYDPSSQSVRPLRGFAESTGELKRAELLPSRELDLEFEPRIASAKKAAELTQEQRFAGPIAQAQIMQPKELTKFEDDKRKELIQSPEGKALADIRPLYETMIKAVPVDTRAADIILISSFARLNDPGSTVREGEIKVSEAAAPWFQAYAGRINEIMRGAGKLTPDVRNQLLEVSKIKVDQFEEAYNKRALQLQDIAKIQQPFYATEEGQQRLGNILPLPLNERDDASEQPQYTVEQALQAGYSEDEIRALQQQGKIQGVQ